MNRPLIACLVAACAAFVPTVRAADACESAFAGRKMSIVVPFKPGGGYDTYARLLAPVLQERTGGRVAVSNIAGANGVSGMKAVASAAPDGLTLGVFDLRDLLAARLSDPSLPTVADFFALGSFGKTYGLWAARAAPKPVLEGNAPLTFGVSTGVVVRIQLPALLLGRDVRLVRGFSSSSERWLALLRGDVDVADGSNDSIARNLGASPGTLAVLLLTAGSRPEFPGVPHLAGTGGLVDQRSRTLDPDTRRSQMELAGLAAELSASERTVAVSSRVAEPLRRCLEQAVGDAIASAALREAATRQKLAVEPLSGADVRERLKEIETAMARHQGLLKRLAADR